MRRLVVAVLVSFCSSALAQEQVWSTPFAIDGRHAPVIVSPQLDNLPSRASTITVAPYALDYHALSQQLDYYEWVYFVGQVAHGSLMLMVKPKFMAY